MIESRHLVEELAGPQCLCGEQKRIGHSFCRACYFSLPDHLRRALYRRIGQGYEKAYANAVDYLKRKDQNMSPTEMATIIVERAEEIRNLAGSIQELVIDESFPNIDLTISQLRAKAINMNHFLEQLMEAQQASWEHPGCISKDDDLQTQLAELR